MISDISQLLQLWRTSATLTCKSWLLCNHSNKNCRLRFPSVYVLCSHVKEGSAVEEIGFSRSNRISALLIALQPDLAQVVLVLVNSSKATPQWLNLHGLKSVTCSGLLSTVSICFTCCFFFPLVISSLIYLLLLSRYMRTREGFSHAGQVTSSALSTVGVAVTRRLADMRYLWLLPPHFKKWVLMFLFLFF